MRSRARSAPAHAWEKGCFKNSVVPVKDVNGITLLGQGRAHAAVHHHAVAGGAATRHSCMMGEQGGFDAVAIQTHPEIEAVNHVHHAGNSSGIVDGAAAVLIGNKEARQGQRPEAARARSGRSPTSARSRRSCSPARST